MEPPSPDGTILSPLLVASLVPAPNSSAESLLVSDPTIPLSSPSLPPRSPPSPAAPKNSSLGSQAARSPTSSPLPSSANPPFCLASNSASSVVGIQASCVTHSPSRKNANQARSSSPSSLVVSPVAGNSQAALARPASISPADASQCLNYCSALTHFVSGALYFP